MPVAHLIEPEFLASRLGQPDLLLLDCRFALDDPAYGARQFAEGHIPGAHFLDLDKDLAGPVIPGKTGRHPLPDANALLQRLRALGLRESSQVVLYDDGNGSYAAHAWWLLVWLGKREPMSLLNGGLAGWKASGGLLTTQVTEMTPGDFDGQPDMSLVVDAGTVARELDDLTLLDARAAPR